VIKIAVGEEEECVIPTVFPASPQSIMVLEKAITQKGHLGNSIKNTVVRRPAGFLFSETAILFLQGLQSVSILETDNMVLGQLKGLIH